MRSSRSGGIGLSEVTAALIEGGYLRAKIKGVSEFDVIAGGLAWCILNSRFSINVEFVENAAIKDKIRISENIATALKDDMKCPHDLQPHQIQGLDYPKIAIVIEWLMKRVAAARDEYAHSVREFTKLDFAKRFGCPIPLIAAGPNGIVATDGCLAPPISFVAAPKRAMITNKDSYNNRVEHASSVLLEYGLKYQIKDSLLLLQHAEALEGDAEMQTDLSKMQDEESREQAMLDNLLSQMQSHKEKNKMSATSLQQVLSVGDAAKLAKIRAAYEHRKEELLAKLAEEEKERNAVEAQKAKLVQIEDQNEALRKQVDASEAKKSEIAGEREAREKEYKKALKNLEKREAQAQELESVIRGDEARSEQYDYLLKLAADAKKHQGKADVALEEGKAQVLEVKQECAELSSKVEELQGEGSNERFEAEARKYKELAKQLSEELALKDQEAMDILRQIDGFPNRAELEQFEKRINELDEEVAWKFEETRHTVNLYNTQAEVAKAIGNEEEVMSSIQGLFQICSKNASKKNVPERAQLLDYCLNVRNVLEKSRQTLQDKIETEKAQLRSVKDQYDNLLEAQKTYKDTLKQLREMMDENMSLRGRLAEFEAETFAETDDL